MLNFEIRMSSLGEWLNLKFTSVIIQTRFNSMTIFFNVAFIFGMWAHPLHVSVTEIEYDERESELEIMMRIFTDDLENAIRLQQNINDLDILNPPKGLTTDKLVGSYILTHFAIGLDGKIQDIRYLGQEHEGEAVVCYLLVSKVKKWNKVEVTNDVLCELFDDQSNLIHVTIGETVKSLRLVKDKTTSSLSFNEN